MHDASGCAVQLIEATGLREAATNNDFVVLVGDPAVIWTKSDKVVVVASERRHRDETRVARRNKEDVCQAQFVTRGNTEINVANSDGTSGRPVEALNGMGVNRVKGFEVRSLRRYVI